MCASALGTEAPGRGDGQFEEPFQIGGISNLRVVEMGVGGLPAPLGCVLWDIRRLLASGSLSVLYDRSERAGLPMGLVGASMGIYLGHGFVTAKRLTVLGIVVARGLPAGSILADVYAQGQCVEAFDDFVTN